MRSFGLAKCRYIEDMPKNPPPPKKPAKTPKSKAPNSRASSKASRPDVQPIGPALAELLNPAINRGEAGIGSTTGARTAKESTPLPNPPPQGGREKNAGLQPPPDNSWDRRSGGEAAAHRARASTRGTSDDVAKRDASLTQRDEASSSPPSTRIARGGVRGERSSLSRSGVGGASADSVPESERAFAEPPPTPDPSPPLRGGRGAERRGFDEAPQANYGTSA